MGRTPTTAVPIIIGTTTGAITGNEKARNIVSGLFCLAQPAIARAFGRPAGAQSRSKESAR
jgi:hypothetical protein